MDSNSSENDDEKSFIIKIQDAIKNKTSGLTSWINSEDGKIITGALGTITSLALGDPTGMAVPLIISCTDSYIRDRAKKQLPHLAQLINANQDNFNLEIVNSVFGQQLLRDTVAKIIQETNEEKIEYLKSFLISTYSGQESNIALYEKYQRILLQMDPIHLQILSVLHAPKDSIPQIIDDKVKANTNIQNLNFTIPDDYNLKLNANKSLFDIAINELRNWGLISKETHNVGIHGNNISTTPVKGITSYRDPDRQKQMIELSKESKFTYRVTTEWSIEDATTKEFITEFGLGFINHFKTSSTSTQSIQK